LRFDFSQDIVDIAEPIIAILVEIAAHLTCLVADQVKAAKRKCMLGIHITAS
jgi:hypothetical protein